MENLKAGSGLKFTSFCLTKDIISKYKNAVEDTSIQQSEFVPPLALAAFAMKTMSESMSLPPGSVHASQEFEFVKPVTTGTIINCQAKIAQKIMRPTLNIMVIDIEAVDSFQELILSGKVTVVLPNSG